jgi:hypothetical protein
MSGTGFEMKEICKPGPIYPVINKSKVFFISSVGLISILVVFSDKIVSWFTRGFVFGQDLPIIGPYNVAAFLGLIPLLSIFTAGYFSRQLKCLTSERYKGTLAEIQKMALSCQASYFSNVKTMALISLALVIITSTLSYYLVADLEMTRIILTVSIGSVLFNIIILNSMVLPILGKTRIAEIAVLMVFVGVILSVPFGINNLKFASFGFLLGCFAGVVLSSYSIRAAFSNFTHVMFRLLSRSY